MEDSDFWTSRIAIAKRQFHLQQLHNYQSSQLDRLNLDDFEVEEEVRPDFPCPYCYEEYDTASLCSHLEDEHSSESRVAVCPICSLKISRDMLNHITLHHRHFFKLQRRRRMHRVAVSGSQALSLLGRDLREAHVLAILGASGYQSNNPISDSLISSLGVNFPATEAEEISKSLVSSIEDSSTKCRLSQSIRKLSTDSSLSCEEREKRMRQAVFVQDLLLSTLY